MKQHLCRVIENRLLWSNVPLLTFDAPELARSMRPGQFALVRDPTTFEPYLRRTAWFYRAEGARVAFTLPALDPLAARARAGDALDVLAPLGRAIDFDANARRVLLIGADARVAPLIAVAESALRQTREVVLVLNGMKSKDAAFPAHLLAPEIEYRTDADALDVELVAWADAVVASGSAGVYRALTDTLHAARYRIEPGLTRVLIDLPMPCGTGECYACAVETRRGIQRACVDGPAFDLSALDYRRGE